VAPFHPITNHSRVARPMARVLRFPLAAWVCSTTAGVEIHEAVPPADDHRIEDKFGEFIQRHRRTYEVGASEYQQRLSLFADRVVEIEAHNAERQPWRAEVNNLADWTPEELAQLRGYRHLAREEQAKRSLGLLGTETYSIRVAALPHDWTWRGRLQAMNDVLDQSSCGSCWAVASSVVLRAHAELYQTDRTFSVQQIIDCVPNPMACGGTGGCNGATAELAMDYVAKAGLVETRDRAYRAMDGECPVEMQAPKPSLRSMLQQAVSLPDVTVAAGGGAAFGMQGWRKVPVNHAAPLLVALYEQGPVAVSVAASGIWNSYASGVMPSCEQDPTINHAVALVGYGTVQDLATGGQYNYWQIQNSWGLAWGEAGFARLLRLDHRNESANCGWDYAPQDGTGCKGGPARVRVCGNCGILYDSVIPKFTLSTSGWLARNPRS